MGWCIRLSLALFLGILLSSNIISFANTQEIKYSMPPVCKEGKVVCEKENEVPVCIVFDLNADDSDKKYLPLQPCDVEPKCVVEGSEAVLKNVEVGCVEYVQWKDNVAHCSDGKVPTCPGNSELNGQDCEDGSEPICDYTWEISNAGAYN